MNEIEFEIVSLYKAGLYSKMRGLALPLGMLETSFSRDIIKTGTDGGGLFFDPDWLRDRFINKSNEPAVFILHQLYHCLLLHPFDSRNRDKTIWQLACDLIVWYLIDVTYTGDTDPQCALLCENARGLCSEHMDVPTTEGIYQLLLSGALKADAGLFQLDDHSLWPSLRDMKKTPLKIRFTGPGENGSGQERWQRISDRVFRSLSAADKRAGKGTRSVSRAVSLNKSKNIRYADFMRRFSVFREVNSPNIDEFQYAYYIYGMERYGNMPIIEPLEYREEYRLDELVIVIDTSGSCSRELAQRFLEETRNIILTEGLFFNRFDLHILQCDCKVQRDDRITGPGELYDYINGLEITGQGGTDYRPAFEYIDGLRRSGELARLKGILYFTDGYGIYPGKMPDYETAFVFVKNKYDDIDVPNWALKLVLDA